MSGTFVSGTPLQTGVHAPEGGFAEHRGELYYRVAHHDAMPPFFMSLVSDSDHWCFLSSNGALTAGRRDPDHALFPYYTDDRIHDSQDQTGGRTLLRATRGGRTSLWEPFSQRQEGLYRVTRSLLKSVHGNKVLFEEVNHDLGLTFRHAWMTSERFGFVRRSELVNDGDGPVAVALVDGILNVLPWGVERRFQVEYSTLADGYKRTERVAGTPLVLFRLSSVPVDKAEPSEALRVNAAWSLGLEPARRLLSDAQFGAFRRGGELQEETDVRGRRGACLLNAELALDPGAARDWLLVADLGLDAAGVLALKHWLGEAPDPKAEVLADVDRGTVNLVRIVAGADGLQVTGDRLSTWRHFSNTLFNALRGGVPDDGYRIAASDLRAFLGRTNVGVAARHAALLEALPETVDHGDLLALATAQGDPDLERLVHEYLPLTFSRRHGDPSRPWNTFSIRVKDERGRKILNYEGNWRDIFQNWEVLGHAYPGYLESMIFKFVDSSTVDGHNPYRLMREGFEWEVSDPHDPWSFIGYWGDHQVIYLLKLLEASQRHHPGDLAGLLGRRVFTYANVPYRIKPYREMLADPRNTIVFDEEAHRRAMELASWMGADGLSVMGPEGPVRANLAEKLLLVALSKLTNLVPGAGIWMNTQRPEWNDANNALVGYGVSVVTLCYLRRYLAFCRDLFQEGAFELSGELAGLLEGVAGILEAHAPAQAATDRMRKVVLDALGAAGTAYRAQVYGDGFGGDTVAVPAARLRAFCDAALAHADHTLRASRRGDGLYHAYNLMKVAGDGIEVRHLVEMLEGQVAVLSSGALTAGEAAEVLDALRASSLYRADQRSYLLYPDHPLPRFLEKNRVPEAEVAASALLSTLLAAGDGRIVARDCEGGFHFNAAFRNAGELGAALEGLREGEHGALVAREGQAILDLYERVFDHQSFTGRSGTFYKYEGLGCIYWHMVSKLLLAVDECLQRTGGQGPAAARLAAHHREIREGIGVHKSPALHGAIPIDPYSHTPGFSGAQQPGMTGQVKEDFLSRYGELGVQVDGGRIAFHPWRISRAEFLAEATTFPFIDGQGHCATLSLEPGSLAFSLCQVPVVAHLAGPPRLQVTRREGPATVVGGLVLDREDSGRIFRRTGEVLRLDAYLGLDAPDAPPRSTR